MADVTITPQVANKAGVAPVFQALNATDTFKWRNSGRTMVYAKNTGGSAAVLTLDTPGTVQGEAIANPTVSVPATTGERFLALQPTSLFNDSDGEVSLTCDQASGCSIAVVQVP